LPRERPRPAQRLVEVVDAERQEQAVARLGLARAPQRRMILDAPRVKAQQHRAIRIDELAEIAMRGAPGALPEEPLVPPEAARHVLHADDGPRALHSAFDRQYVDLVFVLQRALAHGVLEL